MIYATPVTEHGERSVHLICTNEEIGIISNELGEHAFYAHDTVPLTLDLLEAVANFLRTLNV
jgi:hypothetical protein